MHLIFIVAFVPIAKKVHLLSAGTTFGEESLPEVEPVAQLAK